MVPCNFVCSTCPLSEEGGALIPSVFWIRPKGHMICFLFHFSNFDALSQKWQIPKGVDNSYAATITTSSLKKVVAFSFKFCVGNNNSRLDVVHTFQPPLFCKILFHILLYLLNLIPITLKLASMLSCEICFRLVCKYSFTFFFIYPRLE